MMSFNRAISMEIAEDCMPVTPADSTAQGPFRALRATGAGNINVMTLAGNMRVMAFAAGETRYVGVKGVWATSTTATGIEGLF